MALSTSEELARLGIQVIDGRRSGSYALTADLTTLEQVRAALAHAREFCAVAPETEYIPIFAEVEEAVDDEHGCDAALADYPPTEKTRLCAEVIETLGPRGQFDFSGSWSSGETEWYVISTANDREAYRRMTDGKLVLVLKDHAAKWELSVEQTGANAAAFSAQAAIAEFSALLPYYREPGYRSPLGTPRVIFGAQAIAEMCVLAFDSGFWGRGWEEGRAFTAGKPFGERLFSPQITLREDPQAAHVFGMPFDMKGKRRHSFTLVEDGLFRGLCYDTATAARYGKAPTGHDGTEYDDLVLATGSAPAGLAAGLALAGEALYIPFLHYTHIPDPSRGSFTGSSRFNALRVEGGTFTAPLFSTRITDTLPNVFSHVVAVSSRAVSVNLSTTYGPRAPLALSVPEYLICDNVRVNDVAESF